MSNWATISGSVGKKKQPNLPIKALWNDFGATDMRVLLRAGRRRSVSSGTILIEDGKASNELFIILDGLLSVTRKGKVVCNDMDAGAIAGEISFLTNQKPIATVRARTNAELFVISKSKLRSTLRKDPAFSASLYRVLGGFAADRLRRELGDSSAAGQTAPGKSTSKAFKSFLERLRAG
ncbi:MAG: cyclic nucleotide-binding domain-containing protein [Elusimicrobiota bacterium]|nr:MAG: cyclic nucleotide-binding domain-containing protein [Elusimicrobiota bacterium]